ncbi:MAG TPA: hypothetical protein VFP93_01600, partial [Gammaproteobacteria bacterium]|nr:hypothetical protein [Gammaproteobacteria bacterium]
NALQVAVAFGSYASVKLLIKAQANVHVTWNKKGKEYTLLDVLSNYHNNVKNSDQNTFEKKLRLLCKLNVKYNHSHFFMFNEKSFEDTVASTKGPIVFSKFTPSPNLPGIEQASVFVADEALVKSEKEANYQPGVPKFKPGFLNKGKGI